MSFLSFSHQRHQTRNRNYFFLPQTKFVEWQHYRTKGNKFVLSLKWIRWNLYQSKTAFVLHIQIRSRHKRDRQSKNLLFESQDCGLTWLCINSILSVLKTTVKTTSNNFHAQFIPSVIDLCSSSKQKRDRKCTLVSNKSTCWKYTNFNGLNFSLQQNSF